MTLKRIQVLLNEEQLEYLDSVAETAQSSRSETIRAMVSFLSDTKERFNKQKRTCKVGKT